MEASTIRVENNDQHGWPRRKINPKNQLGKAPKSTVRRSSTLKSRNSFRVAFHKADLPVSPLRKVPTSYHHLMIILFAIFMLGGNCHGYENDQPLDRDYTFEDDRTHPGSSRGESGGHSFSSSAYPHQAVHRRRLTHEDLSQMYRSAGCVSDEIQLSCGSGPRGTGNLLDLVIIIENATFYSLPLEDESRRTLSPRYPVPFNCSRGPVGPVSVGAIFYEDHGRLPVLDDSRSFFPPTTRHDLRQALNSRCSGISKGVMCTFNLRLDHPISSSWGTGFVDIFYRCVPRETIFSNCESEVRINTPQEDVSSQFLMSPVYPKYYVGGRKCRWSLRSEPGQRIQLRFLDISLREGVTSRDPECSDSVRVLERGKTLLHMCGESNDDIILMSQRNKLEVRLETKSQGILSRRGILAEYWSMGCATPREPAYGYLHYRNDTHAIFSCSIGYVFESDLERSKTITCSTDDGRWSQNVSNCISLQFLMKYGNSTFQMMLAAKNYTVSQSSSSTSSERITIVPPLSAAWLSDVVLPMVIVGIVVTVSLFAVIVLLILRRNWTLENDVGRINNMGYGVATHGLHDEDRNALTPASLRRCSPILHIDLDRQREELFLC